MQAIPGRIEEAFWSTHNLCANQDSRQREHFCRKPINPSPPLSWDESNPDFFFKIKLILFLPKSFQLIQIKTKIGLCDLRFLHALVMLGLLYYSGAIKQQTFRFTWEWQNGINQANPTCSICEVKCPVCLHFSHSSSWQGASYSRTIATYRLTCVWEHYCMGGSSSSRLFRNRSQWGSWQSSHSPLLRLKFPFQFEHTRASYCSGLWHQVSFILGAVTTISLLKWNQSYFVHKSLKLCTNDTWQFREK